MPIADRCITPVLFVLLLISASACTQNGLETEDGALRLVDAFPALSFTRPVDFQTADDGSNRLFVVEQAGVIRVFDNDPEVGEHAVFLDIRERVRDAGNEEGLLGLAFHPDYAQNGTFFVDYTASDPRRTVIARYRVDPRNPDRALPGSEEVVLEIPQPFGNHNGGQIVFGPDGYLYISMGDGGSGGDPRGNGQDRSTLLGALLRIDVEATDAEGAAYAIPPDNPFAGNEDGFREEIYAYGLRNVWRFSFDGPTGRLWAADVGQNAYEEVNVVERGGNYGWNVMEGLHCFEPSEGCDRDGLEMPVWEYSHGEGSSITGGFVYRGTEVPELEGRYVVADYVSGRIWALTYDGAEAEAEELMDTALAIASFGVDQREEFYVLAFDGKIYRIVEGTE
ncbi:MAG: PQQ-dependent sugar dehydrogenase [Rhodothermales bacterium]